MFDLKIDIKELVDKLLDKWNSKGKNSLTLMELSFLSDPKNPLFSKRIFTIEQFEEDGIYVTKNGDSIVVYGISEDKVRFLLNGCINDMQSHRNFINLMNGIEYSIYN